MRPLLSIKEASGDCGNTQGAPRTDLHGFIKEPLIKPGPVCCVIPSTPPQQPTSDPAPERCGLQPVSEWFSTNPSSGCCTSSSCHFSRTPRTSKHWDCEKGQSQEQPNGNGQGSGERVKKPKQKPPGPGQMETLVPALSLPWKTETWEQN